MTEEEANAATTDTPVKSLDHQPSDVVKPRAEAGTKVS
jgi:hypothetical protein